jgi:V-type H+-transporting ATPase proteolipid subunit
MWPQQSLIPVVMSGIIAVYALVIAVLIASDIGPPPGQNYSLFKYEYLGRIG